MKNDKKLYEEFFSKLENLDINIYYHQRDQIVDFKNGGGYIQQDHIVIEEIKNYFIERFGGFMISGRYLDDSKSPLYEIWTRIYSIDSEYREWGQPYYANNIPLNKNCLNPNFINELKRRERKRKIENIRNV
jgi:hypothetical protein